MAQGLTQRGIPASRLILEEASTSMAEGTRISLAISEAAASSGLMARDSPSSS